MRETRFVRFPRQVGSGVANRQTIKSPGRGIHSLPISIRSSTGDHFHSARPFGATVRARFHRDVLPDRRWKRRSAFPLTARAALQRSSVHHRPGRCAGGGGCTRFSTTIFFRTFVRTCGRSSVYNRCTRLVFTCHPSRRSSMVRRRYPYRTCVEAIALSRAAGLPADLCRSTRKMGVSQTTFYIWPSQRLDDLLFAIVPVVAFISFCAERFASILQIHLAEFSAFFVTNPSAFRRYTRRCCRSDPMQCVFWVNTPYAL